MSILERLASIRHREHAATVELIEALVACQRTRAHVDAGYRSVFHLLVERLSYSPAAASRRFAAMRCAMRCPVAIEMLRDHRTSLTALAKIAPVLDDATDVDLVLRSIDGRGPGEVDTIVAGLRPVDRPPERVRPIAVRRSTPVSAPETLWGSSAEKRKGSRPAETIAPAEPEPEPEPRIALSLTLSRDDHAAFERARARLGRSRSKPLTLEETIVTLVREHEHHAKRPAAKRARRTDAPTRHIPKSIRARVFERDGSRCTYVAPDGTRCSATRDLQIDHVQPFALGGSREPGNLRVLCGAHNRRRAERIFGKWE